MLNRKLMYRYLLPAGFAQKFRNNIVCNRGIRHSVNINIFNPQIGINNWSPGESLSHDSFSLPSVNRLHAPFKSEICVNTFLLYQINSIKWFFLTFCCRFWKNFIDECIILLTWLRTYSYSHIVQPTIDAEDTWFKWKRSDGKFKMHHMHEWNYKVISSITI